MKGRQVRLLFWFRDSVVRLVSASKMPAGRLLRLLLARDSVVRPVRPAKSPACSAVREGLLEMVRVVIPTKSGFVMSAQADLPDTAATIASRTSAVRLQTVADAVWADASSQTASKAASHGNRWYCDSYLVITTPPSFIFRVAGQADSVRYWKAPNSYSTMDGDNENFLCLTPLIPRLCADSVQVGLSRCV